MLATFGAMPTAVPAGYFRAVRFPVLAKLDQRIADGRRIHASGFGTRELPLSIKAMFVQGIGGHVGSELSGTLFEVTIDPENGVASGRGFLLNDPVGRRHARAIHLKAMRGNSVDLADAKVEVQWDFENDDIKIDIIESNLAATTGVSTPAFAEAYAEVDPLEDDELMASLIGDDPMEELVASYDEFTINLIDGARELTASLADTLVAFDDFFIPEADHPQKVTIDEHGRVFGHPALWDSCWSDDVARCITPPRPTDNYASFNKPGVLTDRGIVECGPIMAYGGHRSLKGTKKSPVDAYGGMENVWADVRASVGRFGPWVSGRVRPGVEDETIYAARASQISGHWLGDKLKVIVSCAVGAYDVPGSGLSTTPFSFTTDETGVTELVASFPPCIDADLVYDVSRNGDGAAIPLGPVALNGLPPYGEASSISTVTSGYIQVVDAATEVARETDEELNALLLAALLDDD